MALLMMTMMLFSMAPVIEGKLSSCRNRFTKKEDWVYCTKFGAATSGKLRIKMRARFLAKHSQNTNIQVAVYKD
jgi:hypothetical protein